MASGGFAAEVWRGSRYRPLGAGAAAAYQLSIDILVLSSKRGQRHAESRGTRLDTD